MKTTEDMRFEQKAFMDVAKGKVDGFTFNYDTVDEARKAAHRLVNFRSKNQTDNDVFMTQIIRRKNVMYLLRDDAGNAFRDEETRKKAETRKAYRKEYDRTYQTEKKEAHREYMKRWRAKKKLETV